MSIKNLHGFFYSNEVLTFVWNVGRVVSERNLNSGNSGKEIRVVPLVEYLRESKERDEIIKQFFGVVTREFVKIFSFCWGSS